MFTVSHCIVSVVHSQGGGGERTLELLWGTQTPRTRGPRPRVSLDDIGAVGVRWADAYGVGAITLAAVAGELGLTATALYRYLDSKDALLELMVDHAIGVPPRLSGTTWRERVREWTETLCDRYRRHPWLAHHQTGGMPHRPSTLAWIELLLRELDHSPVEDPMRLALLLDGLARTFALITGPTHTSPPPPGWLLSTITERHPRFAAELDRDWSDIDAELAHALDTVLTGAEYQHVGPPPPAPETETETDSS